jgi:hypothetical protein
MFAYTSFHAAIPSQILGVGTRKTACNPLCPVDQSFSLHSGLLTALCAKYTAADRTHGRGVAQIRSLLDMTAGAAWWMGHDFEIRRQRDQT